MQKTLAAFTLSLHNIYVIISDQVIFYVINVKSVKNLLTS